MKRVFQVCPVLTNTQDCNISEDMPYIVNDAARTLTNHCQCVIKTMAVMWTINLPTLNSNHLKLGDGTLLFHSVPLPKQTTQFCSPIIVGPFVDRSEHVVVLL
jgi:hypothetical protein